MERPRCAIKDCNNGALVQFYGRIICGDCVMKFYNKTQEDFWKDAGDE